MSNDCCPLARISALGVSGILWVVASFVVLGSPAHVKGFGGEGLVQSRTWLEPRQLLVLCWSSTYMYTP